MNEYKIALFGSGGNFPLDPLKVSDYQKMLIFEALESHH
jgi:hypothetical protein